jgi:putative DNA modification/repair radical SAM protein
MRKNLSIPMRTLEKLEILGAAGKWDVCSDTYTKRKESVPGVCHTFTPDGKCIHLFKTLFTNSCVHDCKYCTNSSECQKKVSFEPQELANLFRNFYVRNYVDGFFLSSGVAGNPDIITEKIIETASIVREEHGFTGYMHLKVLPGASYDQMKQLAGLADRLSVNLEAPNSGRFSELSSTKDYKTDLLRRLSWIKGLNPPGGITTQFVVGSGGETDIEYLKMTNWLYENLNLRRIYFSAFDPVPNTPFEFRNRIPLVREHRLYQADWLLRKYGFDFKEVEETLDENGNLDLKKDPKQMYADNHPELYPVNPKYAEYEELLRVPGIGPRSAARIVKYCATTLRQLKQVGVVLKRAAPYLEVEGNKQMRLSSYGK